MPTEVILPRVDMTMESGVIDRWTVSEGDQVREGDTLFEITTDKALVEVDAPAAGVIRGIRANPGQEVAVGSVVAWIFAEGEAPNIPLQPDLPDAPSRAAPPQQTAAPVAPADGSAVQEAGELRSTPLARRVARELGLELRGIAGSGPRGRIGERDVRKHAAAAPPPVQSARAPDDGGTLVPFSAIRRTLAARLSQSAQTAPHFYMTANIQMAALQALQAEISPHIERRRGVKVTLSVLLVRIVAALLKDHPLINASVEGQAARLHGEGNIGVAMERDGELFVPVIHHSHAGSIESAAVEFDRLRKAVMSARAAPADFKGGTFTITNLGMYGVDAFTAIINPPESAILAVGRITETPVGCDGSVVLAPLAAFCLSSDHRIVDGVTAARFMADLRKVIEHPVLLL
jgi:pyruvate dehydrogenase E2 component (dihydrolipoamide acetyltransferase)